MLFKKYARSVNFFEIPSNKSHACMFNCILFCLGQTSVLKWIFISYMSPFLKKTFYAGRKKGANTIMSSVNQPCKNFALFQLCPSFLSKIFSFCLQSPWLRRYMRTYVGMLKLDRHSGDAVNFGIFI